MSTGVVETIGTDETFTDTREPGIYYENSLPEMATDKVGALESQIIPWAEVRERIPRAKVILPGWYYESSVTLITGGFGSFKSLVALKQAACINQGVPCFGCEPPEKRKALYLYLESPGGLDSRMEALEKDGGIERKDIDVDFIIKPPDFFQPEGIQELNDLILKMKYGVFFVDVALSVFGAHGKSTTEHMGEFMAACRKSATETGSAVSIIHHPPKSDSEGSHGGMEAFALADVWWVATKTGNVVTYQNKKQKEGDLVQDLKLITKPVEISSGTSVVVERYEKTREDRFTENDFSFLKALQQVTNTMGTAVHAGEWKELASSRFKLPQGSFGDSRVRLLDLGYVQKMGNTNKPTYSISTAGIVKLKELEKS
ncbi:MAG: hypothetical protein EB101_07100 [Chitinophagia bacterium]|nr:hypothetical protein [Chitinophagia bacterium]